jgi:hypothetical protein
MTLPEANLWDQLLGHLREVLDPEEYRRWFGPTSYASDSGDLVTVWVPSESIRRHIASHYGVLIDRTLRRLRPHSSIRFVVTGGGDDEDEE